MKRLVVCCDGTWNRPENQNVTNIEKIARTVETHPENCGDCQQLVYYLSGVGSHWYWFDRVLGGAFGFGLFANVTAAYRFLALNYEPGDEIFVFGFSRGAYTARSIVGMIGRVGLLTRDALIDNKLGEAVDRYRAKTDKKKQSFGSSNAEFKHDHCQTPDIDFLGVFDTVGALGVPGALRNKHKFHDVKLSPKVRCARHALALDERRIKFEPSLWQASELGDDHEPGDYERVKQVWFEGVHSDTGGGYDETGLSDTALLWMVDEARSRGLVFSDDLLSRYVNSGSSASRHDSLNKFYRVLNGIARLRAWCIKPNPRMRGNQRLLEPETACGVRVASSAVSHWRDDEVTPGGYVPANLAWFAEELGDEFDDRVEAVEALPSPSAMRERTAVSV